MSAIREALILPAVFLTVALLGGLRIGGAVVLAPPSPFALILGILLMRLLIQSGALLPERLLSTGRTLLENVNGAIVLVTLWAASAQIFTLLIPDAGLPRVIFNVLFVVLLLNTAAANPDRRRLLRSLAVTLGSTFVLKFVVLHELSTPGTSWLKRILQAALDGITLGLLTQEVLHPAMGYVALLVVALFLCGVWLLPYRPPPASTGLQRPLEVPPSAVRVY